MNLLEALVTLSIVALVSSLVLAGSSRDQSGLEFERAVSELNSDFAFQRHKAVQSHQTLSVSFENLGCPAANGSLVVTFHSDGTISSDPICIGMGPRVHAVNADPFTGRIGEAGL